MIAPIEAYDGTNSSLRVDTAFGFQLYPAPSNSDTEHQSL